MTDGGTPAVRTGWGFDAHQLVKDPPLWLGGVEASDVYGVEATSDGDVLAHAVTDALLGACVLGDMGELFPSSDPAMDGANSMDLLATVVSMAKGVGWRPTYVDVTVIAEEIRVAPLRADIRMALAAVLKVDVDEISVKATTTDGMGLIGEGEGIAAVAVITVESTG